LVGFDISRSPTCRVRPVDRTHNWEPFLHRFSRFHPAVPFVFKDFRVNGNRQRFQTPGGRGLLFPLGLWADAHLAQVDWLEAHFEGGGVGLEVEIKSLWVGEEGSGDLGMEVVTALAPLVERSSCELHRVGGGGRAGVEVDVSIDEVIVVGPVGAEQIAGIKIDNVVGEDEGDVRFGPGPH